MNYQLSKINEGAGGDDWVGGGWVIVTLPLPLSPDKSTNLSFICESIHEPPQLLDL